MLESVTITDLSKAVSLSYKTEPGIHNLWVSIGDPEHAGQIRGIKSRLNAKGIAHFNQFFVDWSDESVDPYVLNHIDIDGPRESHVNNIISFLDVYLKSPQPIHLGVNCYAGISRSTAIGVIAWVMSGKTPQEAMDEIIKVRPQAWPNLRMLKFASARLGVDIYGYVLGWKRTQHNGVWAPYLPEK